MKTTFFKKHKKLFIITISTLFVISMSALFVCDATVKKATLPFLYSEVNSIPATKAGLLLGTSKLLMSGKPNSYFTYRIEAAIKLYNAGKIKAIVISGDNSKKTYNEPEDMKAALITGGIPDSCIYLDFAGFRTFDSVVRMNKIFGQNEFIIISQEFHNARAVYISQQQGLKAYGFNAKEVTAFYGLKTNIREKLARVKLFIDFLFNIKPKFLGERVYIK